MPLFVKLTKSLAGLISKSIKKTTAKNAKAAALTTTAAERSPALSWLLKLNCTADQMPNWINNNPLTSRYQRIRKNSMLTQMTRSRHPASNATSNQRNSSSLLGIENRGAMHSQIRCLYSNNACKPIFGNMRAILSKYNLLALTATPAATMSYHQHQIVRTKCGRENCADDCKWPVCPPDNTNFPKDERRIQNIYASYWDKKNDDCCDYSCKWAQPHPRFDDMYHRESDKEKRIYTRTWAECVPITKPKRVCCFDGIPPDVCLRPKKERPQTACPPVDAVCLVEGDPRCLKIRMPCCCEVAKNVRCRPVRRPAKCKRYNTPYPSFSECLKPRARPPKKVECSCLNSVSMCDVYAYWRKRIMIRAGIKC